MPYIDLIKRRFIDPKLRDLLAEASFWQSGELAYVLYRIVKTWLGRAPDYARFVALTGVMEETLAEVRRRMVVPYEERKREENGDV